MSGQVVEFDQAAAERRAERIRLRLDSIADNYAAVMPMIREAINQRDDLALGYPSVSAYVADRFGGALQRLGVEVRREVVRELTAAGMSTRAIAPVVGTSHETVRSDLSSGVKSLTPEPDYIPDHVKAKLHAQRIREQRAAERAQTTPSDAATGGEVTPAAGSAPDVPSERVEPPPQAPRRSVTGLDGKTYTPREPSAPRRVSLADDARNVALDLQKVVARIERIATDDRLGRNKEEVAARLRHHLDRAIKVCQDLHDQF